MDEVLYSTMAWVGVLVNAGVAVACVVLLVSLIVFFFRNLSWNLHETSNALRDTEKVIRGVRIPPAVVSTIASLRSAISSAEILNGYEALQKNRKGAVAKTFGHDMVTTKFVRRFDGGFLGKAKGGSERKTTEDGSTTTKPNTEKPQKKGKKGKK